MKGKSLDKLPSTINTKEDLIKLIKEKILPAYKKAYKIRVDPVAFGMGCGICYYAEKILKTDIYAIVGSHLKSTLIAPMYITNPDIEKTILPRIEWMEDFIKNKSVKG